MAVKVRDQAAAALAEADVALFVADAVEGLTPLDEELARTVLARFPGKVIVLANKVDHPGREALALDFYRLGVEKVYPVSAEHALGLDAVMAEVLKAFPRAGRSRGRGRGADGSGGRGRARGDPRRARGPPERRQVLARQRAARRGARRRRRDAGDDARRGGHALHARGGALGARRHRRASAAAAASRATWRSTACCAPRGRSGAPTSASSSWTRRSWSPTRTRTSPARSSRRSKACVVVVNKWDLVDIGPKAGDEYRDEIAGQLKHLAWAPVLLASAMSGRNVGKLLDLARAAHRAYSLRIPTPELNAFFRAGRARLQAADAQGAQDLAGLHHPGGDAAADVRGARQRGLARALHLPALPREPPARGVRPRRHLDRAALPQQGGERRGRARQGAAGPARDARPQVQRREAGAAVREGEARPGEAGRGKPATRKPGARKPGPRSPAEAPGAVRAARASRPRESQEPAGPAPEAVPAAASRRRAGASNAADHRRRGSDHGRQEIRLHPHDRRRAAPTCPRARCSWRPT